MFNPMEKLEHAKRMLDMGAIDQAMFEQIRTQVMRELGIDIPTTDSTPSRVQTSMHNNHSVTRMSLDITTKEVAFANQDMLLDWLEKIDSGTIDFDDNNWELQKLFETIDTNWPGSTIFGIENSNGNAYGWINISPDKKIKHSLRSSYIPQISEKNIRKIISRGHQPTILSLRFSLLVPAAYWIWFRYNSTFSVSTAGRANGEQEEKWLQEVLGLTEDWFFLDKIQLQESIPTTDLDIISFMDVLFPSFGNPSLLQ